MAWSIFGIEICEMSMLDNVTYFCNINNFLIKAIKILSRHISPRTSRDPSIYEFAHNLANSSAIQIRVFKRSCSQSGSVNNEDIFGTLLIILEKMGTSSTMHHKIINMKPLRENPAHFAVMRSILCRISLTAKYWFCGYHESIIC